MNVVPWIIGSLEAAEALKIIMGDAHVSRDLVVLDVWDRSFESLPLANLIGADCPACRGEYESLHREPRTRITSLCGQNAVQIWNTAAVGMPLAQIRERLSALGPVEGSEQMLRFPVGEQELVIFYDGRTIVRGTRDQKVARALYAKYVGM